MKGVLIGLAYGYVALAIILSMVFGDDTPLSMGWTLEQVNGFINAIGPNATWLFFILTFGAGWALGHMQAKTAMSDKLAALELAVRLRSTPEFQEAFEQAKAETSADAPPMPELPHS